MLFPRTPSRLRALPAWTVTVVMALVLTLGLIAVPRVALATEPVADVTGLTVTSTGDTALAGGEGQVTVRAVNDDGDPLYNASVVVVLPVGVSYVAGSATPGGTNGVGEPSVRTWVPDPTVPDEENPDRAQVLVWENVADLPQGAATQVGFAIEADDARYPVGSTFSVGSGVYASADERDLPMVTIPVSGPPEITGADEGDSVDADVTVIALSITKAETANAEAEIYRGPGNPARFTVTVRTAPEAGTDDVVVVDRVPAVFTVLGCDDADYTCRIVEVDGEVFTELTWDLGNVAAGRTIPLSYDAYVDLREVVLPGATTPGAPTRPLTGGYAVTNTAEARGTYTGDVADGATTSIATGAETTVTVLDVGIVKTVEAGDFVAGATADYSFQVRTSEYVDSSAITVIDTIPDGMCPIVPAEAELTNPADWPAECAPAAAGTGTVTGNGGAMERVTFDPANGTFTVEFSIADRAEDEDAEVGYSVLMRAFYQDGSRTSVGDTFQNGVELAGTVAPVASNTVDSGTAPGANGSSASIGTERVTLAKEIWTNDERRAITGVAGAGTTCTAAGDYRSPAADEVPALQLGDLVCFRIIADFPAGVATRDVVVGDFLPPGTSLVEWSATAGAGWTTVEGIGGDPAAATQWQLGETIGATRFVAPGDGFELFLLARVDEVPAVQPKVTGNLAKLRYLSGDGSVVALRDDVGLALAPAPPLTLDKNVDGVSTLSPVQEGQALTYTIDVAHDGAAADLTDYPLDEIEVSDLLPAGFDCGDITTADPAIAAGACVDRGDGRKLVTWTLDLSADPLRAGETTRISYTLTVPSPLSISSSHTNTAAVTRFTAVSTNGLDPESGGATFYPANPVGAYPSETKNAAEAADSATVRLAGATVDKSVTATSVTGTNNSSLTQATIGELVSWSYSVQIPAKTSVFNGVLDEQAMTAARWTRVGLVTSTAPAGVDVGSGCVRDAAEFRLCSDDADPRFGDLLFPTTWTNDAATAATFEVRFTARVADVVANAHNQAFPNTAVFTSTPTTADSGAAEQDRDAAQVSVVVPSPSITKGVSTSSATGPFTTSTAAVDGGQVVYYRLTATNGSGRPALQDAVVVDCIDARMTEFTDRTPAGVAALTGPVAGDGTNGCATGRTKYTWTLTNPLLSNAALTYSARVPSPIPASSNFRNDATVTGSTLAGAEAGERTLSATTNRTVTAANPTVQKVRVAPSGSAVPGEDVTWRVTVSIPAGVNLFDARILDTLPASLGVAADADFTVSCGTGWTTACPTATRLPAPAGNPQVLGVYLGDVAADASVRTVVLEVTSPVLATVPVSTLSATNNARISWNTVDAAPPSTAGGGTVNTADVAATVEIRHPAVTVDKIVSAAATPKAQGEIFTYTVSASALQNASPNGKTAYDVVIVDTVPADVSPVVAADDDTPLADGASVDGGGVWNAGARTLTWTLDELAPGAAATQTFRYFAVLAEADELTGGALVNTVTPQSWSSLDSDGKGYGPGPSDTASVTPAFPRIDAAKVQQTANPVYIGDEVTFRVTLTNGGTADARSLDAVDTLPAGWAYVPGSTVIDGSAATDPAISGQVLTWAGLTALTPSQSHSISYRAVASTGIAVGSSVAHTNTVRAAQVTDATGGTSYNGGAGSYIGTTGQATARIHQADVRIAKTAQTFVAGGTGTFRLSVTNAGSDPAVGVTVTDTLTLPEGVTFVSATGTGWTCAAPNGAGEFSCARTVASQTLAAGGTWPVITVTLALAADVAEGTEIPNTASVAARTEDRTPGNNTSAATGTVTTRADLSVVKAVTVPAAGPVIAGEAIEWSVTLRNNGPSVSRATAGEPIVLVDDLPGDVSGIELRGTVPAGCEIATEALRCEITSDLAVGDTIVVRLGGTVDADVAAGEDVIVNTASVTAITDDPDATNDTSTVRTDVAVEEDLTVVKSVVDPAPPAAVVPGESIAYRIEVGNRGPSDARGVFVVDTLPEWTTFEEITGGADDWTASVAGDTVTFTLDGALDVPAGQSAPALEYTVTLDPAFIGAASELLNTAAVSSTWYEAEDLPRPIDTAQPGPAQPSADLALTKTVRPVDGAEGDPVIAGETAVYTFTVDNAGPSDAGAVTLTDTLPEGLDFVTPLPSGCTADGADLECVKTSGLTASESAWSVSVTVRVDPAFLGTTLTNGAAVTSVTPDPRPVDNVDTVELDVIQRAQLRVVKEASDDVVTAGEEVTWTLTVENTGPSDAQEVALSDVLDPRLVLVDVDAAGPVACSGVAVVACAIGTIPAGESVEITVTTAVRSSVEDGSTIDNAATATSSTLDVDTGEPATATGDDTVEVVADSELTIVKTATTPTVTAGETAVYRIAVGSDGPSDAAAAVVVTDTLPAGLTFLSAATVGGPARWDCTVVEDDVVCELHDGEGAAVTLAAGADAPLLEIVSGVDAALAAGTLTNMATVESPSEATPPTDTAEVEVERFADLGITKTNVGVPTAGERYSWTIEVTNHGPSDSTASADDPITVSDTLPEGTRFVEAAGADCRADDGASVSCEITDTMTPGDTVAITLTVDVAEEVTGALTNTAAVAPGLTPEPASAVWPNEATAVTPTVVEEADLAVEKVVLTDDADIVAGQPIRWGLTVTNLGPSNSDADADNPIVLTDTLPDGVTADAVTPPSDDWECSIADDGSSLRCASTTDLATDDPQVFAVDATVAPDVQGEITNVASVAPGLTPQPLDSAANDSDAVTSEVAESADLRLRKDVLSPIVAGARGTYLLQIVNDGPSTARGVTLVDTLPEVLTFERVVPADGEDSPWTCAADESDPTEVSCSYAGEIAPGTTPVDLVIEVSAASDLSGSVTNRAVVSADTPDPREENNSALVLGVLSTSADLRLAKSHDEDADAVAGAEFTWTLTVTNDGPSDSLASAESPIVVTDTLPDGIAFVPVGSDAGCAADDLDPQTVVCEITSTIAAGDEVSLDLRVALAEELEGTVTNTAVVAPGDTADSDTGNNAAADAVPVVESADLTVVKDVLTAAEDIVAGRQLQWTVRVTNLGPSNSDASAADPITVVDTLPAGVGLVGATGDGWSCAPGAEGDDRESVVCERAEDLPVGDAPVLTVTGLVASDVQGEVRNDVAVFPGLTPNDGDSPNTDEATSVVGESADLALSKAVSATITAGGGGAYTLAVTNLGPSAARDITVTDTLPEGLSYAGVEGEDWTCAVSETEPSDVVCAYDGVLAPADTLSFDLGVDAAAGLQGDVVNTAVVRTSTPDGNADNDTATASGTIAERVDLSIVKTAVGSPEVDETFAYELRVRNAGPSQARAVRVEDLLPAGLEVVDVTGDGWDCAVDDADGRVACLLSSLDPDAAAPVIVLQVRVLPAAYPEVSNTATVAATTPEDPDATADNTSTATVAVPAKSELSITKTRLDELVTGAQARYRITVQNSGPTADPGPITVTDALPDGLVARAWMFQGADGSCELSASVFTCTVDGLAVGQSVSFVLTVDVAATAVGTLVNTATVSSVAGRTTSTDTADGQVTVVDLPSTGGELAPLLQWGVALLLLGGAAVWWARRRAADNP